jgi:hypothetical protein
MDGFIDVHSGNYTGGDYRKNCEKCFGSITSFVLLAIHYPVIYFKTNAIDRTLQLATENGATILYPKTDSGLGFVAEFEDTEGNRIALYQLPD